MDTIREVDEPADQGDGPFYDADDDDGGERPVAAADISPARDLSQIDPPEFTLADLASAYVGDLRRYAVELRMAPGDTDDERTAAAQSWAERTLRRATIQHFVDNHVGDLRAADAVDRRRLESELAGLSERERADRIRHGSELANLSERGRLERIELSNSRDELSLRIAELQQELEDERKESRQRARAPDPTLERAQANEQAWQRESLAAANLEVKLLKQELLVQMAEVREQRALLERVQRSDNTPRSRDPNTGRPRFNISESTPESTPAATSLLGSTPFSPSPNATRAPGAAADADRPARFALTPGRTPAGVSHWVAPDLDRSGESLLSKAVRAPSWGTIDPQGRLLPNGLAEVQSGAFMLYFRDLCRYLTLLKLGGVLKDVAEATGSLPPGVSAADAESAKRRGAFDTLCHQARMCAPTRINIIVVTVLERSVEHAVFDEILLSAEATSSGIDVTVAAGVGYNPHNLWEAFKRRAQGGVSAATAAERLYGEFEKWRPSTGKNSYVERANADMVALRGFYMRWLLTRNGEYPMTEGIACNKYRKHLTGRHLQVFSDYRSIYTLSSLSEAVLLNAAHFDSHPAPEQRDIRRSL